MDTNASGEGKEVLWRARDHRKQRHMDYAPGSGKPSRRQSGWRKVANMRNIEYWNVSWWVAVLFTLGSVVWVINGFIVFLPFVTSVSKNPVSGGWSAWLGATIFAFASLFLIPEAWNRSNTVAFGWGVEQVLRGRKPDIESKGNGHKSLVLEESNSPGPSNNHVNSESNPSRPARKWVWWTTDTKYWHELGFLAGFVQLCAATIFWISGFSGLPEIQTAIENNTPLLSGAYWTPQVIGGSGFMISSTLYMLETQTKWYKPNPADLGWQIGFWNFIGAVGFTLCGIFGYSLTSWRQYQSCLSTFWGGWAFLIGSTLQWYEAVNAVRPASSGWDDGEKS
ncbi:hypothetical protein JAAARDRAFT_160654 [Jaapia argillacea MUCL 33604]|uniref:Integral membrane protein n=1 Tax=Jaapia argillacea MUCL 33604 TaxID=933084 RepID=A0A067PI39_9AGAM|nr:hypothetical protein JAAARDRAFT_160654 [Jaapia argillacea MUCL 33604]